MAKQGLWCVTVRGEGQAYTQTYFRKEALARNFATEKGSTEVFFRAGRTYRGNFYPEPTGGVWGF